MGLVDGILNRHNLKVKNKSVPYHFEIHDDKYCLEVESLLDRGTVSDLFFKGLKKMRKKSSIVSDSELPASFSANPKQLKALERVVINKRFLEDVSKQIRKDVPTFKIINSSLGLLSWEAQGVDQYKQRIVINGVCFYEE